MLPAPPAFSRFGETIFGIWETEATGVNDAHESLVSRAMLAEVPLAGLTFLYFLFDLSSWNLSMVTDVSNLPIRFDRDRVAGFCRDRGIVRLSLFGSVLREDFDPDRSDIDVLADFKPEATRGIGFRFFGYGDELAGILGRKVDFCSRLDPRLEPSIRREAVTIYEDS
jgi:predicted nucleotidyltransferase